jgi:hypothetical protein
MPKIFVGLEFFFLLKELLLTIRMLSILFYSILILPKHKFVISCIQGIFKKHLQFLKERFVILTITSYFSKQVSHTIMLICVWCCNEHRYITELVFYNLDKLYHKYPPI